MTRANRLQKISESLEKFIFFYMFLTVFPLVMPISKSLPSLFTYLFLFKEWLEGLAPSQPWVIRSGRSWQKSDGSDSLFFHKWSALFYEQIALSRFRSFALSLFRSQKTNKSLEKPMSEFPTLVINKVPKVINTSSSILVYVPLESNNKSIPSVRNMGFTG